MKSFKVLLASPATWGFLAFALFLTFLSPWVYPGEASYWMAHLTGALPSNATEIHPLASLFYGFLARLSPSACAVPLLNGATAFIGALSVALLCVILRMFFRQIVDHPSAQTLSDHASALAIPMGAIALMLSPFFFLASTHLQWQTFDLFLILSAVLLILRVAKSDSIHRLIVASAVVGAVVLEAPMTLLFAPALVLGCIIVYSLNHPMPTIRTVGLYILLPMGAGALFTLLVVGFMTLGAHLAVNPDASFNLFAYCFNFVAIQLSLVKGFFALKGWLLFALFGILPCVLTIFTAPSIGKNIRNFPTLLTTLTIALLAGLTFVPIPASPDTLFAQWGEGYPLLVNAMIAFAIAFIAGAGILILEMTNPADDEHDYNPIRTVTFFLAPILTVLIIVVVLGGGIWRTVNVLHADFAQRELPRETADLILSVADNKEEFWLLSDDVLDPYLALRIAETKKPVILLSRQKEKLQKHAVHQTILNAMETSPIFKQSFEKNPSLRSTLQRSLTDIGGLDTFLQDWIRLDEQALTYFATLDLPDLWFAGNREPLPETFWYRGALSRAQREATLQVPTLPPAFSAQALTTTTSTPNAVDTFARLIRRRVGFITNNIAYFLAYTPRKREAYECFRKTYQDDPENLSAFINCSEMLKGELLVPAQPNGTTEDLQRYNAEVQWLTAEREWCAKEVEQMTVRFKGKRIPLAKNFGYIRSPQVMSSLYGRWAMTGATGAALSLLDMQLDLFDDNLITAAQKSVYRQANIAHIYASIPEKRKESIAIYRELLTKSSSPEQSLACLQALFHMNLLENNITEAGKNLEQAEAIASEHTRVEDLGYLRALYHAAKNEPALAEASLLLYLTHHQQNIEATAMLATLQMQAEKFQTVRNVTMQKLITAAGTEDNYFVKIIQAQLEEQTQNLHAARTAYLRAYALNPEVTLLRDTILSLDIRLNDRVAAAEHAKKFLYQDRKHPLANYIMGSLALNDGELDRALAYLLDATSPDAERPVPAAYNDLAETYRRLGRWSDAYATAQQAYKLDPQLAVAHETAAAALLELGRYTEAHAELDIATSLDRKQRSTAPIDPRILITRARLHVKENNLDLARITLAEAHQQYPTLDSGAKKEFNDLARELNLKF